MVPRIRPLSIVVCLLAVGAACSDDGGPGPTTVPFTVSMPNPVEGRFVTCTTCPEPDVTVVLEFPVTLADAAGPGGTLERLETIVVNTTRGGEIARNARPNANYAFPSTALPSGGALTVEAAVGFAPPPPRDDVRVTVEARLTDGRVRSATSPLVILPAEAAVIVSASTAIQNGARVE